MKPETQRRRLCATLISVAPQRTAGDRLQNKRRSSATPDVTEDKGVSNIEQAGNQAADQNRFEEFARGHLAICLAPISTLRVCFESRQGLGWSAQSFPDS